MLRPGLIRECEGELPKGANTIESGGGPTMCWQRPHMKKSGVEKVVERDEEATTSPKGFSYPKKQSIGHKRGGLGGVSYCCRGGSIDHEERDADARQRIVGLWAWQLHGTAEAGLSYSHQSLALMEGERWL
ncbi:hypothetical protein BHM03_00039746 [Ensete ventricosum]|nr:hypothetical protein BHM03_00039746 [Ensete ventricosum]